jgi:hypothetical protein
MTLLDSRRISQIPWKKTEDESLLQDYRDFAALVRLSSLFMTPSHHPEFCARKGQD